MIFSKFQAAPFGNKPWVKYGGWMNDGIRYGGMRIDNQAMLGLQVYSDHNNISTGIEDSTEGVIYNGIYAKRLNNSFVAGVVRSPINIVDKFLVNAFAMSSGSAYKRPYVQSRTINGHNITSAFLTMYNLFSAIALIDIDGTDSPSHFFMDDYDDIVLTMKANRGILFYLCGGVPDEATWWAFLESELLEVTEDELNAIPEWQSVYIPQSDNHNLRESSFSCSVATPPKSVRADIFSNSIMHSCILPDVFDAGLAYIAGKVTVENITPVSRKVRLYDLNNGRLVGETWSDEAGNYRFSGLVAGKRYFAVAHDHTEVYNAAIQDRITADDG